MAIELAPDRQQTRARSPDESGYVERDGVRVFFEVYGRAARPSSCCRRGRSSTRGSGRGRSRTWRATSASSRSTGAATAAPTARRSRRPTTSGVRRGRARRAGRDGDRARDDRGLLAGAQRGLHPRRRPSRAGRGRDLHRAGRPAGGAAARARRLCLGRASSTPTRAGRSTTGTTGCATIGTSSSSSSAPCSPSRTRRSRSRTPWAGRSRRPRNCSRTTTPASTPAAAESHGALPSTFAARCSSSTATRTRSTHTARSGARRGDGRASSSRSRVAGMHRMRGIPCMVNLLVREFVERLP